MGSGCCSVGRAVTFDIRGQRFESSHRLTFILNICLQSTVLYGIDKNKERRGQEGIPHFYKKTETLTTMQYSQCTYLAMVHM